MSRKIVSALTASEGITSIRRDMEPCERVTKLYSSLTLPSYANGYNIAIEYMYNWFAEKFPHDYFKGGIYVDAKHVLDEYKQICKTLVKKENPKARIVPTLDFDYDRDGLDVYNAPPELYIKRSKYQDSFFKDYERNMFFGFAMRAQKMNFNFKVRVNTRMQQLDIMNKIELNFRIGSTQTNYISVDLHVPKTRMIDIARRAGFEIKNGEIVDILEFINYFNQHSELPLMFKIRAVNQKPEFFIRINDLYTHIFCRDKLQKDDGERDGKLDFNFHVEFEAELILPVPHYYVLYSEEEIQETVGAIERKDEGQYAMYSINIIDIPKVDEHGWNQAAITSYATDKDDLSMDLSAIFSGNNVLAKTIHHDMLNGVSPSHFINIKVYEDQDLAKEIPIRMDWNTFTAYFNNPIHETVLQIAIYYDRVYINELDEELNNYKSTRYGDSLHDPRVN